MTKTHRIRNIRDDIRNIYRVEVGEDDIHLLRFRNRLFIEIEMIDVFVHCYKNSNDDDDNDDDNNHNHNNNGNKKYDNNDDDDVDNNDDDNVCR
jgi:hypothetical protein